MKTQLLRLFSDVDPASYNKAQRAALVLPLLQRVQGELGYIPAEAVEVIARLARVSTSYIYGVASFYAQFSFVPVGRNLIVVCDGTACHVKNSNSLLQDLRQRLGIGPGETTPDGHFSLNTVACFGSCALAPVVVVNGQVYGRVTRHQIMKLIDQLAAPVAAQHAGVAL